MAEVDSCTHRENADHQGRDCGNVIKEQLEDDSGERFYWHA